jgi:hypothetical protein
LIEVFIFYSNRSYQLVGLKRYLHSNKELSPLDKGPCILVGLGVKLLLYVILVFYLKARSFNKSYANLIFKPCVCYEAHESLIFYR